MDSIVLARIIGLFGAISTLLILLRYKAAMAMEEQAAKNAVLVYASGFLILLMGVVLVVIHPIWTSDWRVIITIIGWLVFLKGLLRILSPEKVKNLIEKKRHDPRFMLGEMAVLLISLYLLYQGFLVA